MSAKVPGTVQLRILGFEKPQCTGENYWRVVSDPIISERRVEAYKKRPGWPNDLNVFSSYKTVPGRRDDAHLNFPANFNIEDEASVLAIFNKMTEQERLELRARVLDQELQATFGRIIRDETLAMHADDSKPGRMDEAMRDAVSKWRSARI